VLAEHQSTSVSKRDREVIILTVGAAWQAPYELYAHCAVGRHVGLSDDEVRTLAERWPIASRVPCRSSIVSTMRSIARRKNCSAPRGSWTPLYLPVFITPCVPS
jgi:hypothetical protein